MNAFSKTLSVGTAIAALTSTPLFASSHMDAPLITLDDPANTTDVYAFRSASGDTQYLTTAVAVYPFEEPGIGPNNYRFDDNVLYEIHVAVGDDVGAGRKTISYQFDFDTAFEDPGTILQSYLGVLEGDFDEDGFDVNQNLRQSYTVTKVDHRTDKKTVLGSGVVPPNNQGLVTPEYNQSGDGEMPAKEGVDSETGLDVYTRQAITDDLEGGYRAFAGQRDDGFYADIQSIFDLDFGFGGPNKPFDSQGGFNLHTIVLDIPLDELGEDPQVAGVYATTSRRILTILSPHPEKKDDKVRGRFVQVARQGNPLFNEALVAIADKDLYNRTDPTRDEALFKDYALVPELAAALGLPEGLRTGREDIKGIFIPDLIKVDLSTGPAHLAGNPDDSDFHRLSGFGEDMLVNGDGVEVAGGFPNGRRFGDDVLDIAVIAILTPDVAVEVFGVEKTAALNIDGVLDNDISHNQVFPYAATPQNGRNHGHH